MVVRDQVQSNAVLEPRLEPGAYQRKPANRVRGRRLGDVHAAVES